MKTDWRRLMAFPLASLFLAACSGGGGESSGLTSGSLTATPEALPPCGIEGSGRTQIQNCAGSGSTTTPAVPAPSAIVFTPTGNMTTTRAAHTATLLLDGRVLIAGGYQAPNLSTSSRLSSAELYDPATGTFTPTPGSMSEPRAGQAAVLLPNGKVLIVGGASGTSAELFDPATATFSMTGSMQTPEKTCLSATLLSNGKVLVAKDPSAELYDPTTQTFTTVGDYAFPGPCVETATLLVDGRVVLIGESLGGSQWGDETQLYDPTTNTFSKITNSPPPLGTGLELYTVTLLSNGKVMVAGGTDETTGTFSAVELYDPVTGTFSAVGNMQYNRDAQAAALLSDGRVLITGGDTCSNNGCRFEGSLANAEVYDPATGSFSLVGSMNAARSLPTATLLKNGDVLVVGGEQYCGIACFNGTLASAELYHPQ